MRAPCDHLQAERSFAQAQAGDVHHVDRSAGGGGVGDHLLQGVDDSGFDRTAVAHVNEEGDFALGREAEQRRGLRRALLGQVSDADADALGAFVEAAAHAVEDLAPSAGVAARSTARSRGSSVPLSCMTAMRAGRSPLEAPKLMRAFPRAARTTPQWVGAHFELQRRGDAVARFEAVIFRSLPVGVEVDEAWGDHQALGVDGGARGGRAEGRRRDGRDLAGADADVAHGVEIGGRVEDAPVGDHEIVVLREERNTEQYKCKPHAEIVAARDNVNMSEATETTIARQREATGRLARLIANAPLEALREPPAPGKWSVVAILAHLAEDELSSSWRYRQMLENPGVALSSFDQEEWARRGEYAFWDIHEALEMFRLLREANIRLLARLTAEEWQRFGVHEERGRFTVAELAFHMTVHDASHIEQIRRILEAG